MGSTYIDNAKEVAIVAWQDMDLTDFTGPLEVLSHARTSSRERLLRTTIAAASDLVGTSQGVKVGRDVDIPTLLSDLPKFDILIIPGGGGFSADSVVEAPGVREVLEAFAALPARPDSPRVIMSICAGAFFLAEAGMLVGKIATTHYAFLQELDKVGRRQGDIKIVRQHYVDAGVTANGTQVITSGGIVSGFDSTLYLLEQHFGFEVAERSRAIMDAAWRKEMTPYGFA